MKQKLAYKYWRILKNTAFNLDNNQKYTTMLVTAISLRFDETCRLVKRTNKWHKSNGDSIASEYNEVSTYLLVLIATG